jgi:hypothetical protein
MRHTIFLAAIAATLAIPAFAQDTERYRIERTDEGFVRMDTTTGNISVCKEQSGQLVCRAATDDRLAYEDRIDDLERRVEALESGRGTSSHALPSEEEFEQSLGYMRRFFQNFFDMIREWEGDLREPQPDRT